MTEYCGYISSKRIIRSAPAPPSLRLWLRRWLHSGEATPCGVPIGFALLSVFARHPSSPSGYFGTVQGCGSPPLRVPPFTPLRGRRFAPQSLRFVAGAPLRGTPFFVPLSGYDKSGEGTFALRGSLVASLLRSRFASLNFAPLGRALARPFLSPEHRSIYPAISG